MLLKLLVLLILKLVPLATVITCRPEVTNAILIRRFVPVINVESTGAALLDKLARRGGGRVGLSGHMCQI